MKIQGYIKKIEKADIVIFMIILLNFLLTWMAFSPAIMTSDGVGQLQEAYLNNYNNAHPVLHSFIIGAITKTFGTVSAVSIFQILIFSYLWTICCKITRKDNNSKKIKVLQIILTVVIAITPINFMYSITIWKDILYTYSILGLLICIYIGLKNKFNYSYLQMIATSITLIFIMKFRHNGMPIGAIMFIILLILNFYNNCKIKKKIKSLFLILIFTILLIISYIPQLIYCKSGNDLTTSSAFTATKVCCMGVLLKQDIKLDDEEYEIVNSILDIETWKQISDPYWGTAIIYNENYNKTYLNEHIDEFSKIVYKYAKLYPKEIIKYFAKSNSTAWNIKLKSCTHIIFTNNDGITKMSDGKYDTIPKSEKLNSIYLKYIDITMNNKFIYTILYRPVILMCVAIVLNIYIVIKKRSFLYILLGFPMILNIGTYIPFVISQEVRYLYPNYVTCYFIILVTFCLFENRNFKETKTKKIDNPKVIAIIPAYNEEKSVKNVIENIYRNNKCDVLVVNDGSKDDTCNIASKTNAIVIDLPNNLGIGGAVQTGYLYAYRNKYDIAIQVDADGQHNPKYIPEMVELIKTGQADMVIGSRFIEKTSYKQTFFRMLGIKITSGIIKLLTGKKIYDTTSGFRAISKSIIGDFAKDYPYDYPEPCTNMEMILKNRKVVEISVEMKQRETGNSSISPVKSVKYMIKVVLSLLLMRIKERRK